MEGTVNNTQEKKFSMMGKAALGATGLAVASGMVVTGVVLARNEKARKAVTRGVVELIKGAQTILMQGAEKYQAVSHRISVGRHKRAERISGLGLARRKMGRR